MKRVLVSPVDYTISNSRYGKSYNLLNSMTDSRYKFDAYVGFENTPLVNQSVRLYKLNSSTKIGYYFRAFYRAGKEVRTGSVDVYHHMNLSYRWFNPLLLAGIQGKTPVIIGPCQTGHSIMSEEFQLFLSKNTGIDVPESISDIIYWFVSAARDLVLDPVRLRLFMRTLQEADRVVVVHEQAKAQYAEFVDESKIEVIPLGVDVADFTFIERSETKEFVAIGKLSERKAYDVLLNALADVKLSHPDVHLHIFGDGPLEADLRRQATDLGVADNVTFHGFVDQSVIKEYLARARAFVHPSHSESFSLVRLEAMATGCPVIVSDIHGAREMVRDGKEGFVVPSGSAEELTAAMLEVLEDFDLAQTIGRNARNRVEAHYDWRKIANRYVELYEELS